MAYHLDFSKQAQKDIDFHKKSGNKTILKNYLSYLMNLSIILLLVLENPNS